MSTTRRAESIYSASSAALSHDIPLPSGSVAGDLVILAACNPSNSATFTFPGTTKVNAGDNTMHYGVCDKTLDSTDISAGHLTVGISTSQLMAAICVGYTDAASITVGTVWSKAAANVAPTTSPEVSDNSGKDVLVFSLIKHSSSSQAFTSTTPSITDLTSVVKQGTSVPSAYAGVYTGTPEDVVVTWAAASTNGVGFQVSVLDAPVDGVEWNTGDPVDTGATVSGTITDDTIDGIDVVTFPQGAGTAGISWVTDTLDKYSIRFYLHTPDTWSDTSLNVARAIAGTTLLTGVNISGSLSPGQVRYELVGNTTEAFRTTKLMNNSDVYRVEMQIDTVNHTIRGALFPLGGISALFDSGVVSGAVGVAANKFSFGRLDTMISLPDFSISRVKITNDVGDLIGRDASDVLGVPEVRGLWNGSSLDDVEVLGFWNGTEVVATDMIVVT